MNNTLGNIIKTIREENGISRTELSKRLNVSYSALQHWENDRRDINIFALTNLLNILNSKLIIEDTFITIHYLTLDEKYTISFTENNDINFIYKYNGYGIIKKHNKDNDENTYSIVHINTLTTPYLLKLAYKSLEESKFELHKYVRQIKFPILEEITATTSGKLLFMEQISKIIFRLGFDKPGAIIQDIAKKKPNYNIEKMKEKCFYLYGEKDGLELFKIIIRSISKCYKRALLDDIVKGYDSFLNAITKSTKGSLQNIHQKHALLKVLDANNNYEVNSYLSSYEEYDTAILNIINEDIYKYGYPSFYKNVINSINKSKSTLKLSTK